ncbi:hypothetical protein [Kribbella solani]|uniref:Uncharacterized protein n=1 Tax=Kribbella solani TaxID=236067 RepID=A0A841E3N9_9ACTN|nr:hypothetical protein [Kribbella solani]MBB5983666.1 hypothetical protein [Kribbella solani]MDX2969413.1 hypothetical protein [Kribbella solani]MDX3002930.1 hypothetical protein [Kribbella solani]
MSAVTTCAVVRSGSVSSGPDELLLACGVPALLELLELPEAAGLSSEDLPEQAAVPVMTVAQIRTTAPYRRFRPAPRSRRPERW